MIARSVSCRWRQCVHVHQVVHDRGNGQHPADLRDPEMAGLAQQPHRFRPPKDLLHALAFALTHGMAGCRALRESIALARPVVCWATWGITRKSYGSRTNSHVS